MVVVLALAGPSLLNLKGTRDTSTSAVQIASILDQARAYPMANNTYVFVGLAEVSVSASTTPLGRVAVAVVASKDGMKHFSTATTGQGSDWQAGYGNGGFLAPLGKLQRFDNMHLASSIPNPANSPMTRPVVSQDYTLGNASCASSTPFTWPLGTMLSGGYQYQFVKVIQFDPQGVARITFSSNGNEIGSYIEIDLQPTNGAVLSSSPNVAAIQIDCMTGVNHIYQP
jgi:hypothetical protein